MKTEATQILALNAFREAPPGALDDETAALVERRKKTFGAASVLFYREPLTMVRAEGAYLYASDGRRYLDFYNNGIPIRRSSKRFASNSPRSTFTPATCTTPFTTTPRNCWRRLRQSFRTSFSPAPAARATIWRCASRKRRAAEPASSSPKPPITAIPPP
jgi:hypothetical protein